jgi:hypothetical protein
MGEMRNGYNILVGKPEQKKPPERCRCRWENKWTELFQMPAA